MSLFSGIVTRDVTESVQITVEADSPEQAKDKLLSVAKKDTTIDWQKDDNPPSDIYLGDEDAVELVYETKYQLCKHCDHFVDENPAAGPGIAKFVHLEDGEQEFDHDGEPLGEGKTLSEWRETRPDLFVKHSDDKIGPNSIHHDQRGKTQ